MNVKFNLSWTWMKLCLWWFVRHQKAASDWKNRYDKAFERVWDEASK